MKKKLIFGMSLLGALVLTGCNNENGQSISQTPDATHSASSSSAMESSSSTSHTKATTEQKLYIVGDSTVDEFLNSDGSAKDSTYFYERCGWGGHIKDYVTDKLTVINYGQSGRSSKDYLSTSYYSTIMNEISEGDFLMIGFGHNDEKSDDESRFTDASKPTTDPTSFKYSLYENYIKKAEEKGATAILCTPIVRLNKNNDYSGSTAHNTSTGNYAEAIRELGTEKNVKVIDLTTYTKDLYTEIGYDEAVYYHAITSGVSATEPNLNSVDTTHINNYGAKVFDFYISNELYNDSACRLSGYIKDERVAPTKANDLTVNKSYKYVEYAPMDLNSYNPASQFRTITSGLYGTAFGDCGGDPNGASNGYYATETSEGVFKVGQSKDSSTYFKGKISGTSEGIAFLFKRISINDNFTASVDANITTVNGDGKQDGFGLMLRDACFAPTNDKSLLSNYVAAGIWRNQSTDIVANFSRNSLTAITKSANTLSTGYAVGDTAHLTITRTGQAVKVTTEFKGTTYETNYLDFDFIAMDSEYFYLGMFAARGTIVEFTNFTYTKTGESQGA